MKPREIIKQLSSKENFTMLDREVSDKEILQLEQLLRVKLPDEYKDFLKRFGYLFWFGISILGIAPDEDDSVVFWTKKARADYLPKDFVSRPKNGVVVCEYGGGGYYFLYCKGSKKEGNVVLILDELYGKESTEHWDDFWGFLASFLR